MVLIIKYSNLCVSEILHDNNVETTVFVRVSEILHDNNVFSLVIVQSFFGIHCYNLHSVL